MSYKRATIESSRTQFYTLDGPTEVGDMAYLKQLSKLMESMQYPSTKHLLN